VSTYYCRWCRSGHFVYGFSQIDEERCGLCGKEYVLACAGCATPLLDRFISPSFVGTGEPVNPPGAQKTARIVANRFLGIRSRNASSRPFGQFPERYGQNLKAYLRYTSF